MNQIVTGSHDPNDRPVANSNKTVAAHVQSRDWFKYLIRFQNAGTDAACVEVRGTLFVNVDWGSLQLENASHKYNPHVAAGNLFVWRFKSIIVQLIPKLILAALLFSACWNYYFLSVSSR